jgi:hypothetical protein
MLPANLVADAGERILATPVAALRPAKGAYRFTFDPARPPISFVMAAQAAIHASLTVRYSRGFRAS